DDEEPFFIYVVDEKDRLRGLVPLRKLITVPPNTAISAIMNRDVVSVTVDEDQEEVVNVIRRHDLPAVPVLDLDGRLVGRITHDDVADVIFEEADEDMLRMAGTDAAELERASSVRAARVRMTWLLPCLIGTAGTALVMALFRAPVGSANFGILILFAPMIMAMGGNSGIQASTIIIRGLATQEMAGQSVLLALRREAPIAVLVGLACGVVAGILAFAVVSLHGALGLQEMLNEPPADLHPTAVGVAVSLAMLLAILMAVGLGTFLPFGFRKVGIDPAIASGPLITTSNDVISVSIYLSIGLLTMSSLG
ncbi:MAG: magnesium transporter, partial [Phycisphaerae bacterium]|nr:magnesium transporter [Phycisphaerae bacterium]